jgi:ketosteroid isomerase-like protein
MTNEVDNVRNVLCDWYIAMKNHDIDKLAAALSDTFLLIEHDELMDGKHLIEMLASEGDSTLVANLHDFHITVSGDTAWSTHRNSEVFTSPTREPLELEFLETVVLIKKDGNWLMDRYHATRLSPAEI